MLWPHNRFLADPNTPLAEAVRASTADSVMGTGAIAAENKDDKAVLVELSALLGDVMDFTTALNEAVKDPTNPAGSYHLDPQRSFYGVSKTFPKNVVIETDQTYASFKPSVINTVVDPRSFVMKVVYNFAELPDARSTCRGSSTTGSAIVTTCTSRSTTSNGWTTACTTCCAGT